MGIFKKIGNWIQKQNAAAEQYQFGEGGMYWDPRLKDLDPATAQALMKSTARQVWSGQKNYSGALQGLGDAAVAELERKQKMERDEWDRKMRTEAAERAKRSDERAASLHDRQLAEYDRLEAERLAEQERLAGWTPPEDSTELVKKLWADGDPEGAWEEWRETADEEDAANREWDRRKREIEYEEGLRRQAEAEARRQAEEEARISQFMGLPGEYVDPVTQSWKDDPDTEEIEARTRYTHPDSLKGFDTLEEYMKHERQQRFRMDEMVMGTGDPRAIQSWRSLQSNPVWNGMDEELKRMYFSGLMEHYNRGRPLDEAIHEMLQEHALKLQQTGEYGSLPPMR